jgi:hypothetical protein
MKKTKTENASIVSKKKKNLRCAVAFSASLLQNLEKDNLLYYISEVRK